MLQKQNYQKLVVVYFQISATLIFLFRFC